MRNGLNREDGSVPLGAGGSPVTKSRKICDPGRLGIGRWRSKPEPGLVDNFFFYTRVEHAAMNKRVSASRTIVRGSPGCGLGLLDR